jgi:DNA-nicking Smr family endonuclease
MPKKNDLSDEEKALFQKMMSDVTPLSIKPKNTQKPIKPPIKINKKHDLPIKTQKQYYLSNYYFETVKSETVLSYCRTGIPKKRLTEIKNANSRYEAKLDLHGFNPDDAADMLTQFIDKQFSLNKRIILIIHGKGGRKGEDPILKNLVNHWLPQLAKVLIFHSAKPKDGGTGAVYVLLKRSHENES